MSDDEPGAHEMGIREARAALGDVVHAAAVDGRTTYITNRGRRYAAVVPVHVAEDAAVRERITRAARESGLGFYVAASEADTFTAPEEER